jgi:hypothetical protein
MDEDLTEAAHRPEACLRAASVAAAAQLLLALRGAPLRVDRGDHRERLACSACGFVAYVSRPWSTLPTEAARWSCCDGIEPSWLLCSRAAGIETVREAPSADPGGTGLLVEPGDRGPVHPLWWSWPEARMGGALRASGRRSGWALPPRPSLAGDRLTRPGRPRLGPLRPPDLRELLAEACRLTAKVPQPSEARGRGDDEDPPASRPDQVVLAAYSRDKQSMTARPSSGRM